MGFLKHFRSKSKLKNQNPNPNGGHYPASNNNGASANYAPAARRYGSAGGFDHIARLPTDVVKKIFSLVCPHTSDNSFELSEHSEVGDGCMLCELRDLANCALVRKRWYGSAQELLYHSIRIDSVHYCEREEFLSEQRRRKSRHGAPIDVPADRLRLLTQTLRGNTWLASLVQLIKLPYMTRETCKAELARCVAVLPNLQYLDLPEGFYTGDPACHTLRQELQASCPDIRKMKYDAGAEQPFQWLMQRHWLNLESLELSRMRLEPTTLRHVLSSMPTLHELKISDMPWLNDVIFQHSPSIPDFPPLQNLVLENIPQLTAGGLNSYLARPEVREVLMSLSLSATGVLITELHSVLWNATHLHHLTVIEAVDQSMPLDPLPPLQSITLETLNYEITTPEQLLGSHQHAMQLPSDSFYSYLAQSLLSNSLPALKSLYVRDSGFPEQLLLAPPIPHFAADGSQPPRGFSQPLEVFTKGLDEHEWVFTAFSASPPPATGGMRRGSLSGGRPLSSYSTSGGLGPQWGGQARKSVVVGNGVGGFLAVPPEPERPRTSSGPSWNKGHVRGGEKGSRNDLWR